MRIINGQIIYISKKATNLINGKTKVSLGFAFYVDIFKYIYEFRDICWCCVTVVMLILKGNQSMLHRMSFLKALVAFYYCFTYWILSLSPDFHDQTMKRNLKFLNWRHIGTKAQNANWIGLLGCSIWFAFLLDTITLIIRSMSANTKD